MRQDMAKVIVERPRRGSRFNFMKGEKARQQRLDFEELPYRQSMRGDKKNRRGFDDHLSPLKRYLRKQAGRLWSEVYSEICEHADSRSVVGHHLREHVFYEVEQDVREVDGVLMGRWGMGPGDLYVHPRTGVLTYEQPRARRRYQHRKEYDMVAIDSHHKYVLIDGLWYMVTLRDLPQSQEEVEGMDARDRIDVVLKDLVFGSERANRYNRFRQVWGDDLYACAKRQVGSREIAKILLIKDGKLQVRKRRERNVSLLARGC